MATAGHVDGMILSFSHGHVVVQVFKLWRHAQGAATLYVLLN
jgi:hypothetical protein